MFYTRPARWHEFQGLTKHVNPVENSSKQDIREKEVGAPKITKGRQVAFVVLIDVPQDASLHAATMYVSEAVAKHRLSLKQYTPPVDFVDPGSGKHLQDFPQSGDPMSRLNPASVIVFRAEAVGKKPIVVPVE